jgi:hypothetical protein
MAAKAKRIRDTLHLDARLDIEFRRRELIEDRPLRRVVLRGRSFWTFALPPVY